MRTQWLGGSIFLLVTLSATSALASPSVSEQIWFTNDTDETLSLKEPGTLDHGEWTSADNGSSQCAWSFGPPATIKPHSCVTFGSESNGVMTGTQGNVKYYVKSEVVEIDWDNPYWPTPGAPYPEVATAWVTDTFTQGPSQDFKTEQNYPSSDGSQHAYDTFRLVPTGTGVSANRLTAYPAAFESEYKLWSQGRIERGTPGAGLDFLQFHRNFMRDVRQWYLSQPGADPARLQRWTSVPSAFGLDNDLLGMRPYVQRVLTNDPPFASADELGIYIESHLLDWLHVSASVAFNDPTISAVNTPDNALFYQIHGLIDYWWSQYSTRKDYNFDGKTDLLWHDRKTGEVNVWTIDNLNLTSSPDVSIPINSGVPYLVTGNDWEIVGSGDFTGDGQSDILWRYIPTGLLHVWKMNGTKRMDGIDLSPVVSDNNWQVQGTGDFNGDGQLDILWRHTNGTIHVWTMNGTTHVGDADIDMAVADTQWQIRGTGDFDGDGSTDILWHNHSTGVVHVWKMDRMHRVDGLNVNASVSDINWDIAGTGDFNGDGWLDIVWMYQPTGQTHVWTMNGFNRTAGVNVGPAVPDHEWQIVGDGKPEFPLPGGIIRFSH